MHPQIRLQPPFAKPPYLWCHNMKRLLYSIALLLPALSQAQLATDSLLIEGHYRSFVFQPPPALRKPRQLLFVMHGSGGSAEQMLAPAARLQAIATGERLLLVYPNGYQRFWNECRRYATSAANKENINEGAFFAAMIRYFHHIYGIDTNKVFAAGFSGGGHMAYKLGLTMPGQIRGIAAFVANLPDSASCDCTLAGQPLPVLIVNGTADNVNPHRGGEMFVGNSSFGVVKSTEGSFGYWTGLAGYKKGPTVRQLPNTDTSDACTVTEFAHRNKRRPPVVLLQVNGGGHSFPKDVDVFLYAWAFFKRAVRR
jgi:polyhydroxybutyrate depolymerase